MDAREVITLPRALVEAMYAHALSERPSECCGEIGGQEMAARTLYAMRNVAEDSRTRFEAAPADLSAAQRTMRERGERLLGIYHSHPAQIDPVPSKTDVRAAYYPDAIYFIIGFDERDECVLRAFRIFKEHLFAEDGRWERVEFAVM